VGCGWGGGGGGGGGVVLDCKWVGLGLVRVRDRVTHTRPSRVSPPAGLQLVRWVKG